VAGTAVVVALLTAALLVAGTGDDGPTAQEAVSRAQDAILDAGTFRLHSEATDRTTQGEAGSGGSDVSFRVVTEAEVAGADWRATADEGDLLDEAVALDRTVYIRSEEDEAALAEAAWTVVPSAPMRDADIGEFLFFDLGGSDEDEEYIVSTLGHLYLGDFSESADLINATPIVLPTGLVEAFGEMEDVEIVSRRAGETRLRGVRTVPDEIADAVDAPLPDGVFEIILDAHYRPKAVRLTVEGESTTHVDEISFTGWGDEITVGMPEGEIDETPWIDEDGLTEALPSVGTAIAPTEVPDELVLNDLYPIPEDEAIEGCVEIGMSYSPPLDDVDAQEEWADSPDFLDIYLLPLDCALDYDDTPFAAGEFGPAPVREVNDLLEVQVGTTVVQFDTTYEDDLPAMVASLQPFDLDAEIARIAEQGGSYFPPV
jgi:hypothetical protein